MTTCGICHDTINMTKSVLTSCNHRFCSSCFFNWMKEKSNCPYCRTSFGPAIGQQEVLELEEIIEQTRDWELYQSQIRNNVLNLEDKLNECYVSVASKEVDIKNINAKIDLANDKLNNIINECTIRKNKILKEEAFIKRKRDTMANYMREWQILHCKKSQFKMRF